VAVGIKLARPELTLIAVSGDGCHLGEGGNHFLHTIRRNLDMTILICDNRVYALTKGQSGPTTDRGTKNALDPLGNENTPLNPLALAIVMGAPFVARGFAGDARGLTQLLTEAIAFKGTAVVDVMQPCVSFNKINTYQWYSERIYPLDQPARTKAEALEIAERWGDKIPVGVLYRDEKAQVREMGKHLFRQGCTDEAVAAYIRMRHAVSAGH
jgi:2-oxoglutarate/2-oxoacid ferredoxin oxidoreductase subunit beta